MSARIAASDCSPLCLPGARWPYHGRCSSSESSPDPDSTEPQVGSVSRATFILLSGRGKRADVIYFTLCHEIGHLLRHGRKETFMTDADVTGEHPDPRENDADDFTRETLLPPPFEEEPAASRHRNRPKTSSTERESAPPSWPGAYAGSAPQCGPIRRQASSDPPSTSMTSSRPAMRMTWTWR